ncbi:hypothetical protein N5U27_02175 [Aliarcobacter butzleri]|uniref:hypothetical protein n=1 Tax=Aliarcobacter butzleri TaxID=28197 RepID=UPI0021B5989D|nr:hypothetical protein [Aliarcobacter butzleri]MCT7605300.1 hypothetical protein [Aliarcobacter butzleri]
MTFNVKEEVAKRHFFLKNILENSIGDEELEINRINYNILLKQIKERYFVKFVNGKKVLFATTFHNDKIFLFLDYNSFYICKNINDINSSIKKIKGNNKMEKKNLWILTEERPKKSVIYKIIEKFVKDYSIACFIDNIRILPILNPDKTFSFTYEVLGMKSEYIDKIYIKIVSGYSSFVDFLIFYQIDEPNKNDIPIYAIEETKTDDSESRNTGIFQRASKFVYIDNYYPNVKKIMLYSLQIKQKDEPTETNIFGTRCLLTLGIEIIGKETDTKIMKPFVSIKELIDSKNSMRMPPKGNIPIKIYVYENNIQVSGRLFKSGGLSHDPNIGSLSLICATLRKLGWDKKLEIVEHGLEQRHVANATNKFIRIANRFNIILQGLNIPCSLEDIDYWKYDISGEKLGTIFIHLIVENFTKGFSIYENHAGCERGYFYTSTGEPIVVGKYFDKEKYKSGNKSQIIHIPDLVIADFERLTIINIEGKKEENVQQGIKELDNFDAFENLYIKEYYSEYRTILRTVVLYGSDKEEIEQIEVSFMLNNKGKMILGIKAPEIFKIAIKNLFDYWRVR